MLNNGLPKAAIFGCEGLSLTHKEKNFFRAQNPLGFILFSRNIKDPTQVSVLIKELRNAVGRLDAPILLDQEGGKVARLMGPYWRHPPPAALIGQLALYDFATARGAAWINARLIAADLFNLGINVCCFPLLDLYFNDSSSVLGDRTFSSDLEVVIQLGRASCEGLIAGGVLPVIKHIPGLGRGMVDSHLKLPKIGASENDLLETDFAPFRSLSDMPIAMTSHASYDCIDKDVAGTMSEDVIGRVVRDTIGFRGLVLTDDLSMGALSGSYDQRVNAAIKAGCDVILHCNGNMDEMIDIANASSTLTKAAMARWHNAKGKLRHDGLKDIAGLSIEFDNLIKAIK